jgi:ataxin-3
LNLQQHWFTVRRFGLAEQPENPTPEEADKSHWFNLNSFLNQPEWVGKLYLGMILQQAEDEG